MLATITTWTAIRQLRVHWKQSGEGNKVDRSYELSRLIGTESSPEDEVVLVEECERQLEELGDGTLKQIALLQLDGQTVKEIAEQLKIHVRSVQRKLNLIEAKWLRSDEQMD